MKLDKRKTLNQIRGETAICVDGQNHNLCLTLGALAEIEDALGGGSFEKLQERLKSPSISDVLIILHALLRGGGSAITLELLKASDVDVHKATKAIAKAFGSIEVNDDPVF